MYDDIIASLRQSYANNAATRNQRALTAWKLAERQRVLDQFRAHQIDSLLEIGAGAGHDGLFFQQQDLQVTCADLSPEMVALCREKGLAAYEMDFLALDFPPQSFDAIYAMNCLLHVPKTMLPKILAIVHDLLRAGGLFYMGVYGGYAYEGVLPEDNVQPNRFFAFYEDDPLQAVVSKHFGILDFRTIAVEAETDLHFQAILARKGIA